MKTLTITKLFIVMAFTSTLAQNNTVEIGMWVYGQGEEKVIVLHDWNGDHKNWNPVIPYLNPKEFTYAFMDVRGQGLSLGIEGEFTVTEIANDILKLADYLKWESFSVVGHSFTTLSAQIANHLDLNNRIKSTILICGFPASGSKFSQDELNFFNAVVGNREVTEQAMGALTNNRYTKRWNEKKAQNYLETADEAVSKSYLNSFANKDYSKGLKGHKTPVLVISSEFDYPSLRQAAVKPQFEKLKYKDLEFIDIKNAGHYPNEETPVYLASIIETFIINLNHKK